MLIVGSILISIGILLIFIPFPSTETVANKQNSKIIEGNFFLFHASYPWRSYNQSFHAEFYATNGSFTFLALDDDGYSNWINHLPFDSFFQVYNVTNFITSTQINPPIHGFIHFIIIANTTFTYRGIIELRYLDFLTNWGGLSIGIGSILVLYVLILERKSKKFQQLLSEV